MVHGTIRPLLAQIPGGSSSAPKSKWAHLSQFWPQIPINPEMAKRPSGPKMGIIQSMASGNHQRPPAQLQARITPGSGKDFLPSMHPILKDPGVVHIWYNIALCTIFSQKSNGDIFGTKLGDFESIPNPSPISKEVSPATPSGNSLAATRRPFEDPNHLALQELGCQFSSGLF
ncbi:hypothetical protein O181_051936 [Austropuccinia psidii MF-1]|uniref:Uncharacterized protein n=1 Tax=Austropuccinia psidii MF-1 TaxID=1389203 RepID=A0A9Q3DXD9_9BASI|nr:hypothetical protein [Austropuccinia psidii MF-1]